MEAVNHKENLLKKLESMVDHWNKGDVESSQKDYQYMLGYCESANIDFNNLNKEFFNKFISTKQALDRIRNKAYPKTFEVYRKIYRTRKFYI